MCGLDEVCRILGRVFIFNIDDSMSVTQDI